MKNFLYAGLGVSLYLISGVLFWGNHLFMLPSFLLMMGLVSFYINKNKSSDEMTQNLLLLNAPVILLLIITGIVTNSYEVVFPYLLLSPLVALSVYYLMTSKQKTLSVLAGVYLMLVGIFYYNTFVGSSHFPSADGLMETLRVIGK